jgi:hypothetical protein
VDLGRSLAPDRHVLGAGVGEGQALGSLDGVHHPHRLEPFLLVVGQVVVGAVRAGELGLASRIGYGVGAQHGGHDGNVLGAAVDVPVEGPLQVGGDRVLGRVEGDPEDLRELALAEHLDLAQLAAERDLGGVVDVDVAEHERPVGLERLQARGGQVAVGQEPVAVDALDLGPHAVAELLGGDHSHQSGTLAL